MFALHETTQRRVCRVLFLALCVVPTVLTLVGIAYCNRPWRQQDWQRMLAEQLHIRAELEDIFRPLPGQAVLTNLRFADLRTARELGSIDQLAIQSGASRPTFRAESVEIPSEQLSALAAAVSTWIATSESTSLNFRAERLTITSPSYPASTWIDFSISTDTDDLSAVRFRLKARSEAGEPWQVLLESVDGNLRFAVDTKQTRLPAWLVGAMAPRIGSCGEATFSGLIALESDGHGIMGKLKGQLESIDMQKWIGSSAMHRLVGVADVRFDQLEWSDKGIEVVHGAISARSGAISLSLLEAAGRLFACTVGSDWHAPQPGGQQEVVPFEKLALTFRMSPSGITFDGDCGEQALIVADGRPLMFGPRERTAFPVAQLVNLFHRPQHGWMPDTQEANSMARELPLPRKSADEPQTQRK